MNKYDQYRACPKCGVSKTYGNDQTGWRVVFLKKTEPPPMTFPVMIDTGRGSYGPMLADEIVVGTCKSCGYTEHFLPRDAKESEPTI